MASFPGLGQMDHDLVRSYVTGADHVRIKIIVLLTALLNNWIPVVITAAVTVFTTARRSRSNFDDTLESSSEAFGY